MSSVQLIPTWEAAATIFTQNLLYGTDEVVKEQSRKELIKMASQLDSFSRKRAMQYLGETIPNAINDEWDCQP